MNQTLFNVLTGEAVSVPGVDAREYLATGGWSTSSPVPGVVMPEVEQPVKKVVSKKAKSQEQVSNDMAI